VTDKVKGPLGIDGSPGSYAYSGADDLVVGDASGSRGITISTGSSDTGALYFGDAASTGLESYRGMVRYSHSSDKLELGTLSQVRATIDSSGRLGVNQTAPGSYNGDADDLVVGDGSTSRGVTIVAGATNNSTIYFADGTGADAYVGRVQYNHTYDELRLGATGSTRWTIDSSGNFVSSGGGIDFGTTTTGSGTVTGGLLDDYETGTATVAFSSGGGSVTINPSNNTIRYIKVGKLVHIHGEIAVSSVSSPSGDLQITGLPFVSANVGGYNRSTIALHPSTLTAATELAGFVENYSSYIVVRVSGGTTSGGTAASVIRANTAFVIGGTYEAF
jgi:hypothetical protein